MVTLLAKFGNWYDGMSIRFRVVFEILMAILVVGVSILVGVFSTPAVACLIYGLICIVCMGLTYLIWYNPTVLKRREELYFK
jgi:hypothetical protein